MMADGAGNFSMASQCTISASEARYGRIDPIVAKFTSNRFAQNAAFAQPAPGGALGARSGHARADRAEGGGAQRRSDPQRFEHGAQADLVRRPRSDVLHADGVRAGRMSAKASTSMRWKGKDGVE